MISVVMAVPIIVRHDPLFLDGTRSIIASADRVYGLFHLRGRLKPPTILIAPSGHSLELHFFPDDAVAFLWVQQDIALRQATSRMVH